MRNGCGPGKAREGIILRPLIELKTNNGERVIAKHKGEAFRETKTPREVTPEKLQVLTEANAIADEWVTPQRLSHILGKMPPETNVEAMKDVILAMIADVYKEAVGEIVESQEVTKAIGRKTAKLFQERIKAKLYSEN